MSAPAQPGPLKRLRRRLRVPLLQLTLALVGLLPLRPGLALGALLGALAGRLFRRDRRLALTHLALALPELPADARAAIVARMFRSLGRLGAELALVHRIDPTLTDYVHLPPETERLFRDALAEGRGVVAVTGHVGNWELLFRRFVRAGWEAYAVGKEPPAPAMAAWVERLRGPGRTIWRGEPGAAKKLLRALRSGGLLAMLIDQDTKVQGLFVPFFGRPAFTPRAAAELALRAGAVPIAVFTHRRDAGGHEITARRLTPPATGDAEADVLALTAAFTAEIEREIRAVPHEWVWHHERWKTRP